MRAAVLEEYGVPHPGEWLEPIARDPAHGVVDVAVAGLNPIDVTKAAGRFYGGNPPLPSIAGSEGVGALDGRKVYFSRSVVPFGSMAERTLVEVEGLFDVPEELDEAVAVSCGIAGLAGWLPFDKAELAAGEHVLVLGASGTVGQVAVQAARLRGAGRIVAAARSASGLERAVELGADATVNLADDDLPERLREAADGRIDVVIDPLWGAPIAAAAEAASHGARLVNLGQSAGAEATLTSADIRGKGLALIGHTNNHFPVEARRDAYRGLTRFAAAGELKFEIERIPLEDVAEAFVRQQASPNRKLVIVP